MIYAVIDTNVLVSALFTHNADAATARVVAALMQGKFVPLYNEEIFEEYDDVLHCTKVALSKEDAYLVTGNQKHFPKKPIVVTPAEMMEILENVNNEQI